MDDVFCWRMDTKQPYIYVSPLGQSVGDIHNLDLEAGSKTVDDD